MEGAVLDRARATVGAARSVTRRRLIEAGAGAAAAAMVSREALAQEGR